MRAPLAFALVALPCLAAPVDEARLAKLFGFAGKPPAIAPVPVSAPPGPLPFRLLGTLRGARSLAAVATSDRTLTVGEGDTLMGVEIVTVERLALVVRRDGRIERLDFGATPPGPAAVPMAARPSVRAALGNPDELMRSVRLVPVIEQGRLMGMRATSVVPGSLADRLGLRRGDAIRSVNGVSLTQMDRLLGLYEQLGSTKRLDVELERDGQRFTQSVSLDDAQP